MPTREVEALATFMLNVFIDTPWDDWPDEAEECLGRDDYRAIAQALLDSGALTMPETWVTGNNGPMIHGVLMYYVARSNFDRQKAACERIKGGKP